MEGWGKDRKLYMNNNKKDYNLKKRIVLLWIFLG